MKTLTLIVFTLLVSIVARGEVIIYTTSTTDTWTGNGVTTSKKVTGYLVIDTDGGEVFAIDAVAKEKTFTVGDATENFVSYYMRSSATAQRLIFSFYTNQAQDNGGAYAKGSVSLVDIGGVVPFNVAKTMTVSGFSITGDDPNAVIFETKGSITYNKKLTVPANKAGNDIETVVNSLRASLIGKGYTELP